MALSELVVRTRADSDVLRRQAVEVEDAVWGPLGFLNHTRAHREHYDRLLEDHADLQLCLVDEATGRPVALANCVPVAFGGDLSELPAEGWDWLVETGGTGRRSQANVLGALAISVPVAERGKGYAFRMIGELHRIAEANGFERMIAPVRPSAKTVHPHASMADYIGWQDERGRCFDPWLRSHLAQGGRVVHPCERSMVVSEHIAFWETWAGRRFETSGDYTLAGGLVPVAIDVERQRGTYSEPNVWVAYTH
ncbi:MULTISPECIES: hypothetical protein [Aurantimonas]|uniref:hypothetical protein n=1 Tax=Aurantimonas TaxID=182269 RepID=UPI0004A22FCD|nr:hypothetical protein [Aurantimonas coralicida]